MAPGMLHRLIATMVDASKELGATCDCADMEQVALIVHRIMTYQSRQFHTLHHVFGFLDGVDAQTALAAIFHDLVYYQVDEGVQAEVSVLVSYYVEIHQGTMRLRPDVPSSDRLYHIFRVIFDFAEGQELTIPKGLNEFLSALAMIGLLGEHLAVKDLVAVAVCIEASIPFRGANQLGLGVGEELERRLINLRGTGLLKLADQEIHTMVARAISFANKDVKDFALNDPARFLNNTWKLLPETNLPLRHLGSYSIREYRIALAKMCGYFKALKPENIFHQYRGLPAEAAFQRMVNGAHRNLGIAVSYLQAKLLAIGLLEAIALETGGDAPVALLMGDIPQAGEDSDKLEDFLPAVPAPGWVDAEAPVYRLLKTGRLDEPSFDLKHSPLALFLINSLGMGSHDRLVGRLPDFFEGRLGAYAFLELWDPGPRAAVLQACSRISLTRHERLEALMQALDRSSAV